MAYILASPATDSTHHPAYRYLSVLVIHFNATNDYGIEAEVHDLDTGAAYTLFTRKKLGTILGLGVYELYLQMLMQDLLSLQLGAYGQGNEFANVTAMKRIAFRVYEYYTDANGLVQKNTAGYADSPPFFVTNSALQHEDWHYNTSLRHFTMNQYLLTQVGTNFRWLTNKPDKSTVCEGDSEFLSLIVDTPATNAVLVVTYNSAGTTIGAGAYYFNNPAAASSIYLNRGFRSIGVGPANINNSTWAYTSIGTPNINSSVHHYEVYVGLLFTIFGIPIFIPFKQRTYYMGCPCCDERERLYFLNSLGAIDAIYFNQVKEGGGTVKSTAYQKNLPVPHEVTAVGNVRLDTQSTVFMKLSRVFDEKELNHAFEFLRSTHVWRNNGGDHYVPLKVKDDSLKISYVDQNFELEFEVEFANEFLSPRN